MLLINLCPNATISKVFVVASSSSVRAELFCGCTTSFGFSGRAEKESVLSLLCFITQISLPPAPVL